MNRKTRLQYVIIKHCLRLVPMTLWALTFLFPVSLPSEFALIQSVYGARNLPTKPRADFFERVSLKVDGITLLSFLESYSEIYNFSFFIDRRVDPSTPLTAFFNDVPFIQALERTLDDADLSFCVVDNSVLYIGTPEAVGETLLLFALKSEGVGLEGAPRNVTSKLFSVIDFQIQPCSEPKDVYKSLARHVGLKLSGFDKTPFDLWRGGDFKSVRVSNILTILGLGFNVDYRYDPATSSIKPVAINRSTKISRYYPQSSIDTLQKADFADCKFEDKTIGREKIVCITGSFSKLTEIELALSKNSWEKLLTQSNNNDGSEKVSSSNASNKRVQVSGEVSKARLCDLFAYLEKNASVVCILDTSLESQGVTQETRVSCKFTNSNINQIALIISKQIEAVSEVDGNSITFYAQ